MEARWPPPGGGFGVASPHAPRPCASSVMSPVVLKAITRLKQFQMTLCGFFCAP